jgi:tetratricopeptide (TPR) repeat protein
LDFGIDVGAGGADGYEVVLHAPDGGEATTIMRLPVSARELEALAARIPVAVIASSATVRRSPSAEEKPVQELGGMLFDAVLAEGGRGLLEASRHQAAREGRRLRMVLRIRPAGLARLPWEFLFDSGEDDYVALTIPVIRYPQVLAPVRPLPVRPPLRILGVVARPGDQGSLATAAEQRRLRDALRDLEARGQIELYWMAGQTWRDLRAAMRRGPWHVLHFIGHGGFNAATQEGTLALAQEDGSTYHLGADSLAMLLRGHPSLRLVVLNACDTGRASALDPFSSVAGSLIRRGIPAVLAMQHEITDLAALEFSRTFYEGLADRLPVDLSVTEARQAIRLALPGSLEWGTPVLYMRSPDGDLFDLADTPAAGSRPDGHAKPGPGDTRRDGAQDNDEAALEETYNRGIAALYTERWDEAVRAFLAVTAGGRSYRDSERRLDQARRGQGLPSLYAAACGAADLGRWEEAVRQFEAIVAAEPGYRDAQPLLERARREHAVSALRAEAADLHRAGQWQDVLAIGERLKALTPGAPDPDGLIASARAELESADRARTLAESYQRALHHIDAGEWQAALLDLSAIQKADAEYEHTAQLAERARRELVRSKPVIGQPVMLAKYRAPGEPMAVAFSPDDVRLAVACEGKFAVVIDRSGREQLRVEHDGEQDRDLSPSVFGVAFDQSGGRLATAGSDGTARTWDPVTGAQLLRLASGGTVFTVAFSPDGQRLATGSGYVRIWDASSGQQISQLPGRPSSSGFSSFMSAARFSPDGRLLAVKSGDTACIWDIIAQEWLLEVTHKQLRMGAVAFSPDGRMLATAGDDSSARIWDARTGDDLLKVTHSHREVLTVAFSPDGRLLATGSTDRTARIWDTVTGDQLCPIACTSAVRSVAFSRDGRLLATADSSGTVGLWQLEEETHD